MGTSTDKNQEGPYGENCGVRLDLLIEEPSCYYHASLYIRRAEVYVLLPPDGVTG